ncbi:45620_t:CDS:2, partial [Gigaspora margarita]
TVVCRYALENGGAVTIGIIVAPYMDSFAYAAVEAAELAENLILLSNKTKFSLYILNAIMNKNIHTIDSLKELNDKLLTEIAKLRKENDKISELEKKFAEVEAENAKLKQIIGENAMHDVRVKELEQKNMELEARLAIVEQASFVVDGQTQNGKEAIAKVWLSIDNSVSTVDLSNSIVDQQNNADTKSIEGVAKVSDKKIDDFVPEEPIPKMSPASISIPITQVTNSSDVVTSSLHETTPSLPLSHTSNSENKISENNKSLPETDPEKEILIKNTFDIDALILLLQQKFKMSKKILDKWKADIVFEFRDNTKYWKKERESMPEADFLEYKKNFEAKMGIPTTPHKNELKNKSLALIEYV